MKNRKTITLTLIGLFIFLFSIVGLTYAYWSRTLTQSGENLVYTDCLKLDVNWGTEGFTLNDAYPMTNKELVSDFFPNTQPYHFTITNTCESEVPISINMESLTPEEDTVLKDEYVDVILWEGESTDRMSQDKTVLSKVGSRIEVGSEDFTPSYKLTEHKVNKSKIIDEANTAYQLYKFKLPGKKDGSTENTKEFNLLLFMDYDTPVDGTIVNGEEVHTNNAHWRGKITLNNYIPTLEDVIKELPVQQDDSGNSGIYKVEHTDAEITWGGTPEQIANLKLPELRYAGKDPNNYVDVGEEEKYELILCIEMEAMGQKAKICQKLSTEPEFGVDEFYPDRTSCDAKKAEVQPKVEEKMSSMSSSGPYTLNCNQSNLWRIIGLVNTAEGQRVKLIKDTSIGNYSWDTSASDVNNGYGINEWSQSDLMKLLNSEYETNKDQICVEDNCTDNNLVNNSLYWDGENGMCYNHKKNATTSCNFDNNKMPDSLKNMIEEITWNTGSGNEKNDTEGTISKFYEYERSSNTGKICDNSSKGCNDGISRSTSWKGKVGLIYPSDYGYATSGGKESENNRTSCFAKTMSEDWFSYSECYDNDWLLPSGIDWTLSSLADSDGNESVGVIVSFMGNVGNEVMSSAGNVRPSVYLKSDVFVKSGNGSQESPYVLGI